MQFYYNILLAYMFKRNVTFDYPISQYNGDTIKDFLEYFTPSLREESLSSEIAFNYERLIRILHCYPNRSINIIMDKC